MNHLENIKDRKYKYIISDIVDNPEFQKLDNIVHHGETRFYHCLKVSYYSYKISKFLKLDYKAVARAGLLHDFYFDRTINKNKTVDKIKLFSTQHPKDAVKNATKHFDLSKKEEDIIATHMFPIDYKIPKYMESWIVSFTDKIISFKEFGIKLNYKIYAALNIWIILFINIKK